VPHGAGTGSERACSAPRCSLGATRPVARGAASALRTARHDQDSAACTAAHARAAGAAQAKALDAPRRRASCASARRSARDRRSRTSGIPLRRRAERPASCLLPAPRALRSQALCVVKEKERAAVPQAARLLTCLLKMSLRKKSAGRNSSFAC
jgi:hypothetical protein